MRCQDCRRGAVLILDDFSAQLKVNPAEAGVAHRLIVMGSPTSHMGVPVPSLLPIPTSSVHHGRQQLVAQEFRSFHLPGRPGSSSSGLLISP